MDGTHPSEPGGKRGNSGTDVASILSFPVGRTGTKARRRRGIPSAEPVTSLLGREERLTVLQCAVGGWDRIVGESGEGRARDAFKVAAHQALRALNASLAEDVGLDGSPSRPVLTASFRESDQTREALIAAVDLRAALAALAETDPPAVTFDVRIGVHSAGVVDLVVGGTDPMPFRAVGSLFALAARLQEAAEPGQILLSADTLARAQTIATAHSLGEITLNDHGETREAFCLLGLQVEDGA